MSALESELKWVDNHPEFYYDEKHQNRVKKNIELNYKIRSLEGKINNLKSMRKYK